MSSTDNVLLRRHIFDVRIYTFVGGGSIFDDFRAFNIGTHA